MLVIARASTTSLLSRRDFAAPKNMSKSIAFADFQGGVVSLGFLFRASFPLPRFAACGLRGAFLFALFLWLCTFKLCFRDAI